VGVSDALESETEADVAHEGAAFAVFTAAASDLVVAAATPLPLAVVAAPVSDTTGLVVA
jgi:hypothetical protein